MLKLKYLFDNKDLAEMILKNWDYDLNQENFLKGFRISANAIYPFSLKGSRYFLRFRPQEEATFNEIQGEIEFLKYLKAEGYPAVEIIPSKKGNNMEAVETPWGKYYAVVFQGAKGRLVSSIELTDDIITGWGKALGKLHSVGKGFSPKEYKRGDWKQQLDWMETELAKDPKKEAAKKEVNILRELFNSLPITIENYGLNHFDFEGDNLFYYEEDGGFLPIDFDDAVYHWYGMDIVNAIANLTEEMSMEDGIRAKGIFLNGYRSVKAIDEEIIRYENAFSRYGKLYGYVRCLRSIEEKWDNEPEWMASLRNHLNKSMEERSKDFGKPI